jgi:hypothetical protein
VQDRVVVGEKHTKRGRVGHPPRISPPPVPKRGEGGC